MQILKQTHRLQEERRPRHLRPRRRRRRRRRLTVRIQLPDGKDRKQPAQQDRIIEALVPVQRVQLLQRRLPQHQVVVVPEKPESHLYQQVCIRTVRKPKLGARHPEQRPVLDVRGPRERSHGLVAVQELAKTGAKGGAGGFADVDGLRRGVVANEPGPVFDQGVADVDVWVGRDSFGVLTSISSIVAVIVVGSVLMSLPVIRSSLARSKLRADTIIMSGGVGFFPQLTFLL